MNTIKKEVISEKVAITFDKDGKKTETERTNSLDEDTNKK